MVDVTLDICNANKWLMYGMKLECRFLQLYCNVTFYTRTIDFVLNMKDLYFNYLLDHLKDFVINRGQRFVLMSFTRSEPTRRETRYARVQDCACVCVLGQVAVRSPLMLMQTLFSLTPCHLSRPPSCSTIFLPTSRCLCFPKCQRLLASFIYL